MKMLTKTLKICTDQQCIRNLVNSVRQIGLLHRTLNIKSVSYNTENLEKGTNISAAVYFLDYCNLDSNYTKKTVTST